VIDLYAPVPDVTGTLAKANGAGHPVPTTPGVTAPASELRNAERLQEMHADDLRYVGTWRSWLAWDGRRWQEDRGGAALRCATDTHRHLVAEALNERDLAQRAFAADPKDTKRGEALREADKVLSWAIKSQSAKRLDATLAIARSFERFAVEHHALDADPWALNVQNGTIDLHTGKLRPHRRGDLHTKLAAVEFDPHAKCPLWDAFVCRAMGGDAALVAYLARIIGYSLTGVIAEHMLGFFFGGGANGKSTALGTIHAMLGDYAAPAPRGLLFASKGGRHPTELASLHGRRFVTCSEIGAGQAFDEALVKDLTGGDPIPARRMREDFWTFSPSHKLFIAGNYRPTVTGDDEGIWRRIRLIPWTVTIPEAERDKDLPTKLRAELPGILAWAVRGCLAWQRRGLGDPPAVVAATSKYRAESDTLGEFFRSALVFDPLGTMARAALRKRYVLWCEEAGHSPVGARKLAERLRRDGVTATSVRTIEGARDGWQGVRLATAADLAARTWGAVTDPSDRAVVSSDLSCPDPGSPPTTRPRDQLMGEVTTTSHDVTTEGEDDFATYLAAEGIS